LITIGGSPQKTGTPGADPRVRPVHAADTGRSLFSRGVSISCTVSRRRDEAPIAHSTLTKERAMKKQIILNLPVKDLDKSKSFFSALGFTFDSRFSGENAAFMNIVDGTIQAMLTTVPFFKSLIDKPVANPKEANEVVICLSCESREEVDSLIAKARAAGGRIPHPPEDHGFMYDQGFEDIDGRLWNLVWTAPEA